MGRAVAAFAHHAAVAGADPVELRIARTRGGIARTGVGKGTEGGGYRRLGEALVGRHDGRRLAIAVAVGLAQADVVDIAVRVRRVHSDVAGGRQVVVGITRMAGPAARLVGPGHPRLVAGRGVEVALVQHEGTRGLVGETPRRSRAHLLHAAVAVAAQHGAVEHGATQALYVRARMALVAVLLHGRETRILVGHGAGGVLHRRRDRREQVVRQRAVVVVHHPRVALVGELVATVGDGTRGTGQRAELRQVQRRGVVAHLADHRLVLHQRLVGQAGRVPFGFAPSMVQGWRGAGGHAVLAGRNVVAGGAHVARAVPEVVQAQHVDVGRPLDADPAGQVGVRVLGLTATGRPAAPACRSGAVVPADCTLLDP